jgi:hypothetical protein
VYPEFGVGTGEGASRGDCPTHKIKIINHYANQEIEVEVPEDRCVVRMGWGDNSARQQMCGCLRLWSQREQCHQLRVVGGRGGANCCTCLHVPASAETLLKWEATVPGSRCSVFC